MCCQITFLTWITFYFKPWIIGFDFWALRCTCYGNMLSLSTLKSSVGPACKWNAIIPRQPPKVRQLSVLCCDRKEPAALSPAAWKTVVSSGVPVNVSWVRYKTVCTLRCAILLNKHIILCFYSLNLN